MQKLVLPVSSGFQTLENNKTTRPAASWFQMFHAFGNPMKHSHSFLKYYVQYIHVERLARRVRMISSSKLFPTVVHEKDNNSKPTDYQETE